jgi:spore germination protein GerM
MSGHDDQRMKDLANRLVAMTPEPPPFPEEVVVTQAKGPGRSPVVMFAGAALVVLVLAAIPLLLFRGGGSVDPIATTTTTAVSTTGGSEPSVTTTPAAPTTTISNETTSTTVGQELRGVVIFLTRAPENSFIGNPALVPFFTNVIAAPGDTSEEVALRTLTNPSLTPPDGFENHMPADVEVVSVDSDTEGVRVVDMNQAFLQGSGSGLLGDFTMLNQLVYTATDEERFPRVLFTVGGEPVTQFGTDGLDLSEPLDRETFIDQLNPVILTSAITGSGGDSLVITGVANVFEATVSLQLVDADGSVVYEDFTTATCGTGCWGAFSFQIVDFDFESAQVTARVFWHSAEDGDPADVVSVPVSWGEDRGWDLLP